MRVLSRLGLLEDRRLISELESCSTYSLLLDRNRFGLRSLSNPRSNDLSGFILRGVAYMRDYMTLDYNRLDALVCQYEHMARFKEEISGGLSDVVPIQFLRLEKKMNSEPHFGNSVRRAGLSDFEELLTPYLSYCKEEIYPGLEGWEFSEKLRLKKFLKKKRYFILRKDGRIKSFLRISDSLADTVLVSSVYTIPDVRGHGLAKECIKQTISILSQIRSFDLFVREENKIAQALFLSLGFELKLHNAILYLK
ncbi:MAG: GNAT family N-acetyltransferase [Bacteroidota bacterium]